MSTRLSVFQNSLALGPGKEGSRRQYLIPVVIFGMYVIAACLMLSLNELESYIQVLFGVFSLVILLLFVYVRQKEGIWDKRLLLLCGLGLLYTILLFFIPDYLWGENMDGIMHRSLLSAIVLLGLSIPVLSSSIHYLLGARPSSRQLSGFTLVIVPVLLILVVYMIIIVRIFIEGIQNLDWNVLTSFYHYEGVTKVPGLANYIVGTITLIFLTSAISLPIGVGTGIFISEYGGRLSGFIRFCTTSLRSISVFILALGAYSVVKYSQGTVFHDIINGFPNAQHGSTLVASIFLSLLVIPVIVRGTEEGCSSLPNTLREGSVALGASESFTLRRIILPWALPNVLTGLLLGCAEAAGSVGVLLLIGGYGDLGVGPLGEATSLSLFIFKCEYGLISFTRLMASYQFTAGLLLLLITLVLSIATLVMQKRFARRYRGSESW